MIGRLRIRIPNIEDPIANELITTAKDRILLRVGLKSDIFPQELESICVEIVTAMYNKHQMKHEGVHSESVDAFSMKIVDNLFEQYEKEFENYRNLLDLEFDKNADKVRSL